MFKKPLQQKETDQNQLPENQNKIQFKDKKKKIQNDYLYRVARLKENKMIRQRSINQDITLELEDQTQNKINDISLSKQSEEDEQLYLDNDLGIFGKKYQMQQSQQNENESDIILSSNEQSQKQIQVQGSIQRNFKKPIIVFSSEQQSQQQQQQQQKEGNTELKIQQNELKNEKSNSKKQIKKGIFFVEQQQQNNEVISKNITPKNLSKRRYLFNEESNQNQQQIQQSQIQEQSNSEQLQSEEIQQPLETQSDEDKQQIKGVKITTNPLQGNVNISIINKKQFIMSELPPGIIIKCMLRRSSSFFSPYTQFDFFLNNGLKHIISAKRYPLAKSEIFKISTQIDKYDSQYYVGSLMTNTPHNNYWLLLPHNSNHSRFNSTLQTFICYDKAIPTKGPRSTKIFICRNKDRILPVQFNKPEFDLSFINQNSHLTLINKKQNNEESIVQGYKEISVKSVEIVDEQDSEYKYLTIQKQSANLFEINIQHPLSPLQAFVFALTRFDAQLN